MISASYSFFKSKCDLIHTFSPTDGFAAHLYKKARSIRYVMNFNGVPIASFFEKYPIYNYLMKKSFQSASAIIVNSQFAKDYLWRDYKEDAIVIPGGGVDLSNFYITKGKDLNRPKILCACTINEPYKNVAFLVKAFELFKRKVPDAILQLSGHTDHQTARKLISSVNSRIRDSIHIMGVGRVDDLPRLYSEAAFSVLPSINESFGGVLIESLASGTPVVGTASGGIPEIINDPEIGVLYHPNNTDSLPTNAGDLCDAMLEALELAKDPKIHHRCREHVKPYDWRMLGSKFEEVYIKVLNRVL
jgi:glycosyltransferase involved in cell wall biosynthesis